VLNAVFYTGDWRSSSKCEESLSLVTCDDEHLAPLFASDQMIGAAHSTPGRILSPLPLCS
jgi:hypothetical protein